MASAGLKRPSDFDLNPPHPSGSSPLRHNGHANNNNNPNKRRCMFNSTMKLGSSSPITNNNNNLPNVGGQHQPSQHHHHQNQNQMNSSPFKDPSTLLHSTLSDDVTHMIKNEVHKAHNHCNTGTNEPPVFTIRQTQAICEGVIKEREQKLREEYDKILISKLAEQYDTFVKYTQDYIEKRYNESNSHQASYLS